MSHFFNMELAYHSRAEFIDWFSSLLSIDQCLVGAIPVLLVIYLLAWAMHNSKHQYELTESGRYQSALMPILLLVLVSVGLLWLVSVPKSSNQVVITDPNPPVTIASRELPQPQFPVVSENTVASPEDECPNCPGPAHFRGQEFRAYRSPYDLQFYVDGLVNGVRVKFQVDTGATVTSLPMGFWPSTGNPPGRQVFSSTANGMTNGIQADGLDIRIDQSHIASVTVNFLPNLNSALLGQNVLQQFDMEQRDNMLIFRSRHL